VPRCARQGHFVGIPELQPDEKINISLRVTIHLRGDRAVIGWLGCCTWYAFTYAGEDGILSPKRGGPTVATGATRGLRILRNPGPRPRMGSTQYALIEDWETLPGSSGLALGAFPWVAPTATLGLPLRGTCGLPHVTESFPLRFRRAEEKFAFNLRH